ncbi:MAG: zinc-ribbon domain-containing protein [Candidatus Gastranaerophilales bacterium]|nr:zinc-ribbon domain-containing protein [Candidatus Gastranaerophilales bacterium]
MKKILSILMLILCSFFLTGCVNVKIDEELTVNPDKTVNHSVKCLVSNNVSMFADEINDGFSTTLKDAGFVNIIPVTDMDYFGMQGMKDIAVDDLTQSWNKYFSVENNSKDYFIFKYVNMTVNVDVSSIFDGYNNDVVKLSEYKFTLNLPVKMLECNSQNIFNDGKSATWYFGLNESNSMHVEFIAWDVKNCVIAGISLSGIIILTIVLILLRRKKRKSENAINKKLCPYCSAPIKDDDTFCGSCGKKL